MTTTFAGGNGEDAFAEPVNAIFSVTGVTPTGAAYGGDTFLSGATEEVVKLQDVIEEFTDRYLDVSGWPQATYYRARYVPNDGKESAPKSKLQRITRANGEVFFVLWTPVSVDLDDMDEAQLAIATRDGMPVAGWNITYHVWSGKWCSCVGKIHLDAIPGVGLHHATCGRLREPRNDGTIVPNIGMSDDEYNGFYPTIKGNDPAHWDPTKKGMDAWRGGSIMYGQPGADGVRHPITGREIRGGRKEYRDATKDYYEWDAGYQAHVDRIRDDFRERREADFAIKEEIAEKQLPRKLGEV